jgi:hypothetical protein
VILTFVFFLDIFELVHEFRLAVEAAVRGVLDVVRVLHLVGGHDLVPDADPPGEGLRVLQIAPGVALGHGGDGQGAIA